MTVSVPHGVAALVLIAVAACDPAPRPPPTPGAPLPPTHAGREIAPAMSYLGAPWLERDDRATREQPERVLDALAITAGMVVADVGAGSGYFTVRLAHRVGATGQVIATDLQPEMLAMIEARARREGLTNVTRVQATERDAGLAPGSIDLALLVDVYHELAEPAEVMAGVREALKPAGRLVLVEYRGEDPAVAIKPAHKMTLVQIQRELTALGFRFVESLEFLPDQRIVVFTRDD